MWSFPTQAFISGGLLWIGYRAHVWRAESRRAQVEVIELQRRGGAAIEMAAASDNEDSRHHVHVVEVSA